MRSLRPILVAALLATPATAPAAQKPITGSLGKNGWTVIALAYDGTSASARVAGGKFSVVPTGGRVTLNLRDAAGAYVGPVVVGTKGKRAVVGVRAGAKLGRLTLLKGYARPAKRVKASRTDRGRTAVTRKGRPIGGGRFGLVRARAAGKAGNGTDLDLDGVAGAFDIDDDGDMVLDNNDQRSGTRTRQIEGAPAASGLRLFSNFHFTVDETLNANAGGVTREQIDTAMTRPGSFVGLVFFLPDGATEAELDCGGLTYCSAGGTGKTAEPFPDGTPFPSCCDADGDGLGTITRGPTGDFQLRTFAPSSAIGSGDTFVELLGDGTQLSGSLNYMFNTTPAVKSYSGGATATVSYPAASDAPGTATNPVPLATDASGDRVLTLTFWRPQRAAIPEAGEPDGFVDLGGLKYQVMIPNAPQSQNPAQNGSGPARGAGPCTFTGGLSTTDPNLTPQSQTFLVDGTADAPSDPANTLTLTIDFTKCLAAANQSLSPGDQLTWEIQALSTLNDVAAQSWWVCVPSAGRSDCRRTSPGPPA